MAGDCGDCTMCCKLMGVKELDKPKNVMCTNCKKGVGCTIYDTRPESCSGFRCVWLQTQAMEKVDRRMGLDTRPDKCKVVLHTSPDGHSLIAKVDPAHPFAWREGRIAGMIGVISTTLKVLVEVGGKYWLVDKQNAREVRMSAPDENGMETFEGYVDEHV